MKKPAGKLQELVNQLQEACGANLVSVVLYGSAAREDFTPASDLDFLVEFSGSPSLTDYLGLREDLKLLFGREVDLVMPAAVRNPYIRATIERDRQLLYAA